MQVGKVVVILAVFMIFSGMYASAQSLLNPDSEGFNAQTRAENYDSLIDDLYSGNAIDKIGDSLWVPWYRSSSSCNLDDLHSESCNSGEEIDFENNCMVSDELSQVGILVSMGANQERMNEFYNTLLEIKSDFGSLPSWKVYRDGNFVEACREGINGNCDTASDADARAIIALFNGASNSLFMNEEKKSEYFELAETMSEDFVEYEVLHECKNSDYGEICYWLAAGSHAKIGGMGSNNFAYTGYFGDAVIAMLGACANTGEEIYCDVADDLALNFLQAAEFDGDFSVPPGMSFRWIDGGGVPRAECTISCSPPLWDYADASRAVGICQANYYADLVGHELPMLNEYCGRWAEPYMTNPESAPIQYYANGDALNYQSGYFAQGLQALFLSGYDGLLFEEALDNALEHYSPVTQTWDWTSCFGVYTSAFPTRALGVGIGRDLGAFEFEDSVQVPVSKCGDSRRCSLEAEVIDIPVEYTIENLPVHVEPSGNLVYDGMDGLACRNFQYDTPYGWAEVKVCERPEPNSYEMYLLSEPNEASVCVFENCVGQHSGFVSFVV